MAQLPTRRTYPETNIAPKNGWLEDDSHLLLGGQLAPRHNGWLNHPKPERQSQTSVLNGSVSHASVLEVWSKNQGKGRGGQFLSFTKMVGDKGQTLLVLGSVSDVSVSLKRIYEAYHLPMKFER